jgi:hypothetical protein
MGQRQPLSTPNAAKFAAILRCGQSLAGALSEPVLRRTGATFLPRCSIRGKACGHSTNHLTLSWARWRSPKRRANAIRRSVTRLGTWGGPRRRCAAAER